jgi:6-pyruvoyltetrahydropterin/6-carboxytetrahydropterin synthase
MLVGHKDKCARLHGHTYLIEVELQGEVIHNPGASDHGMVMDYGDIDSVVKPLLDSMDHRMLINGDEPPYMQLGQGYPDWFYFMGVRTTAENIAAHILNHLVAVGILVNGRFDVAVTVHETPKTSATATVEDLVLA